MVPPREADYLVIGAGSSGSVLVERLSADPSVQVLLVEAGASGEADPAVRTPGRWTSLLGSAYDWGYVTEPEPGLDGRSLAFPRGRAHGGSSAINAMVHVRGHRRSFDAWAALGNAGWGYDDLRPCFERVERHDMDEADARAGAALAVNRCVDPHAAHEAFLEAAAHCGFAVDRDHDFNAPDPDGVAGFVRKNILGGRRHSAAAAFLLPALARPNVTLCAPARATRLLLEGRRVVGVEFHQHGRVVQARARREVILCAGAVDSPRLLMLSGIGGADALRRHGIAVAAELPGVGQHLQDHLKLPVRWACRSALPGSTVTASLFTTTPGVAPPADLQLYVGRGLEQPDAFVTIAVSLVRPHTCGSVALRSSDPFAAPVIRAGYLQSAADVGCLVHGVELVRALAASPAFDRLRGAEIEPGPQATSAADLERFVRQSADTIYHPVGTCRMGPDGDDGAVVDAGLRVRGVEGLRVADASIMPAAINAPTHAACAAIGERCAALVRGEGQAGTPPLARAD
jgi:choline dehydrogenase